MPSIKISALTEKTTPAGTEELVVNDGGVSKKIKISNLPDNDTTYSVGDGGLTEINFTSADNTKLDGIATNANNYSHPATHSIAEVSGLQTVLDGKVDNSQVLTNVPSGAVFTDTTYSVGDGGLTEKNFTTALNTKLTGIEVGATADQTQSDINALGITATGLDLGNWTVTESAGVLYFATLGVNKAKLDASGNFTVTGDVISNGTV